jgi:hypothetical protein
MVDASGLPWMLRLRGRLPPEVFDSQPQQRHCGDVYSRCPKRIYGNVKEGELYRSGAAGIDSINTAPGLWEKLRYDVVTVNKIAEQLASMGIAYSAIGASHNVGELQLVGIGYISSLSHSQWRPLFSRSFYVLLRPLRRVRASASAETLSSVKKIRL